MGVGREERESIDERVAAAQRERSTGGSRARVRGGWALGGWMARPAAGSLSPFLSYFLTESVKEKENEEGVRERKCARG